MITVEKMGYDKTMNLVFVKKNAMVDYHDYVQRAYACIGFFRGQPWEIIGFEQELILVQQGLVIAGLTKAKFKEIFESGEDDEI